MVSRYRASVRALVVSNMAASRENPARGVFVRDQVAWESRWFEKKNYRAWLHEDTAIRKYFGRLTRAALGHLDLVATVSEALAAELGPLEPPPAVLPCGVALDRFRPIPRDAARLALGLDREAPCLLFPFDPRRVSKHFDRARELAGDVRLITLGATAPDHVTLAINAANAVLVPSEAEGFGLAVLEALACDVPVLATPVGVHPQALAGIEGTLCAPYDRERWAAALEPILAQADPRVAGRARAAEYSSERMAERVAAAWRSLLASESAVH